MEKIYLSQAEFNSMTLELARKIDKSPYKFLNTIGIERGGLHISLPVSKYINNIHKSIKISFYSENDTVNKEPICDFYDLNFSSFKRNFKNPLLICDDLLDGGNTLHYFIQKTKLKQGKHFLFACLYFNKNNKFGLKPDFWVREKKESEWIVFPHEVSVSNTQYASST